jgi:hypothetical protein
MENRVLLHAQIEGRAKNIKYPLTRYDPVLKERDREFRIALSSARMSMAAFALRLSIQPQSIVSVLKGNIKSKRISSAIDALISSELKKIRAQEQTGKAPL